MRTQAEPAVSEALAALSACAVETAGFRADALSADALTRVLQKELRSGATAEEVARDATQRDPRLVRVLHQAIVVGETFFFRQPEQFEFIASFIQSDRRADARGLRGWSAGCATGEEAYSLAACLLACLLPGGPPIVVGSDLVERNVLVARTGIYRPWSVRACAPIQHPIFSSSDGDLYRVSNAVKQVTRFEVRNLLDAGCPDAGPFDLILCRNVLVYFTLEAARVVCRNLAEALAPGGVIVFGTMDIVEPPPMLERIGPSELQIYRRPAAIDRPAALRVASPQPLARAPVSQPVDARRADPLPPRKASPEPVEPSVLHLAALELIEQGDDARAEDALGSLQAAAPDYVPGLLERALLCSRTGRRQASLDYMRAVLRLACELPPDASVEGPQVLPARFYVASAEAFLERVG